MTEDKIVNFTGQTIADISVQQIIDNIKCEELEHIIILATDKEGFSRAYSSSSDKTLLIYMLEKFKHDLLSGVYG